MNDTIAAISTAPGAALRSIVRISGPNALELSRSMVCEGPDPEALPGFSAPSIVLSLDGGCRAACRMIVLRAPRSYTREDVVEFHLPGAPALNVAVLDQCLSAGARYAEPGEFTRRAYLSGRIDSTQVEGVLALIGSRSDEERAAAVRLLRGGMIEEAQTVRQRLVEVLAAVEAYLDFTDEDTEAVHHGELAHRLSECLEWIGKMEDRLARKAEPGLPKVVILGPPNAGKSTLFKALVPAGRVLTSPEPGTTRDLIEGKVKTPASPFLLYDAPGISDSRDPLERLAVSRLNSVLESMDAVLLVFDGAAPPEREEVARVIRTAGSAPCVTVLNKRDLAGHPGWKGVRFDGEPIEVSAASHFGLDRLKAGVLDVLPSRPGVGGAAPDLKTRSTLERARESIEEALRQDWEGGLEIVAMVLHEATWAVGQLTTKVTEEEILEAVFSRFCIGK